MVKYLGAENIQKATIVYHSEILTEMISNIRAKDKAKDKDNPENNRGLIVFFHALAHVNDPVNFSVNDFNAKGTDLAIVPLALMVWKEYFANRVANEMYPTIEFNSYNNLIKIISRLFNGEIGKIKKMTLPIFCPCFINNHVNSIIVNV